MQKIKVLTTSVRTTQDMVNLWIEQQDGIVVESVSAQEIHGEVVVTILYTEKPIIGA